MACAEAYVPQAPAPLCPFCPEATGRRTCSACAEGSHLDGTLAVGRYADPILRRAVTQWKYGGDPDAWRPLARLIRAYAPHFSAFESFTVSWIPLHADRLRERGFDQAEIIAGEVAASLGREPKRLLMRKSWTAPQARRDGRRVGELDGAFVARGDMPSAVLLCDDVFTSGATMDAAAKELKEAGASLVWGFVLARG